MYGKTNKIERTLEETIKQPLMKVGDNYIECEIIDGVLMVSSILIYDVFKHGKSTNHFKMIKSFIKQNGIYWDQYLNDGYVIKRELPTETRGKPLTYYMMNDRALVSFVARMNGEMAMHMRHAVIKEFFDLKEAVGKAITKFPHLAQEKGLDDVTFGMYKADLIDVGTFASVISDERDGTKIGRNQMFELFRDLGLILKRSNRGSHKGAPYLKTKFVNANGRKVRSVFIYPKKAIKLTLMVMKELDKRDAKEKKLSMDVDTIESISLENELERLCDDIVANRELKEQKWNISDFRYSRFINYTKPESGYEKLDLPSVRGYNLSIQKILEELLENDYRRKGKRPTRSFPRLPDFTTASSLIVAVVIHHILTTKTLPADIFRYQSMEVLEDLGAKGYVFPNDGIEQDKYISKLAQLDAIYLNTAFATLNAEFS